ncbi:MAG: hypothetical protein HC872_05040, partial [Gammaproteobacteria bacterium]|nr:hypothetical protein [Gammaproteobacteria bacterium]
MTITKKIAIAGVIATFAGLPWVTGAPSIILYPQQVDGTLSLAVGGNQPSLASYTIEAIPASLPWHQYEDISTRAVTGPNPPMSWSMTLDGGDPADPSDNGNDYKFGVNVNLSRPDGQQSTIGYRGSLPVRVDSGTAPTVPLQLNDLRTINARLTVQNGSIQYLNVSSYIYAADDEYRAAAYFTQSTESTSVADVALVQKSSTNVYIYGSASIADAAGNARYVNLAGVQLDLSVSDGDVQWSVDAQASTGAAGVVSHDLGATGAIVSNTWIEIRGYSGNTWTSASAAVDSQSGTYSIRVPPGNYQIYPMTYFSSPSGYSYGEFAEETLTDQVVQRDFINLPIRTISLPLTIQGLYSNQTVSSAGGQFARMRDSGSSLYHWAWGYSAMEGGVIRAPLEEGLWRIYGLQASVNLPNMASTLWKYFTNQSINEVLDTHGADAATAPQTLTLTRARVFMDVNEPNAGDVQQVLRTPSAVLHRDEFDASFQQVSHTDVYASSWAPPATSGVASLTIVAEPGTYTLSPKANTEDGSSVAFPETTILFGEPVTADTGGLATWSSTEQQDVTVDVNLGASGSGTVVSVVKTTQGPPVPEGFSALCSPNQDDEAACPPIYYDITTNVTPTSPAMVCIRQSYNAIGDFNNNGSNADEIQGVLGALALYHYRETPGCDPRAAPPGGCWENLSAGTAPPGRPFVVNCAENLGACGCASSVDCGISPDVTVIQLCGVTSSFSPFAVLKVPNTQTRLSATGSGATGSMQRWSVPRGGVYRVTAVGARGGHGTNSPNLAGGCGAEVTGEFTFAVGDTLDVLVGQEGLSSGYNGGGGGGTFLAKAGVPLLIAGGGGGVRHGALVNGRDASLGNNGVSGSTSNGYTSGFVPAARKGAAGPGRRVTVQAAEDGQATAPAMAPTAKVGFPSWLREPVRAAAVA